MHMEFTGTAKVIIKVTQGGGNQPGFNFPLQLTMLKAIEKVRGFCGTWSLLFIGRPCAVKGIPTLFFINVFYGMSDNTWRFWDISNAVDHIAYNPQDDAEKWR